MKYEYVLVKEDNVDTPQWAMKVKWTIGPHSLAKLKQVQKQNGGKIKRRKVR
jgi:hypothetical protein